MKFRLRLFLVFIVALLVAWVAHLAGFLVFDHSAEVRIESLYWKDTVYIGCSGEYNEGRTIAKSSDGHEINEVEEDKTHTFVVVRSFLDDSLYVREDYNIPKSGTITLAYWNHQKITDPAFLQAISEIRMSDGPIFAYETEGIFQLTETQCMKEVYAAYENCPVATNFMGYMGMVNGKWVVTVYISTDDTDKNGAPKPYTVICKEIPKQYISVLEPYF